HRGVPRVHRRDDAARAEAGRLPSTLGPPPVRAPHPAAPLHRVAALHPPHRARLRSRGAAAPPGVAGHRVRRTVRALVTGATGFPGGHLARHLAAQGHVVRALVRARSSAAVDLESAGIALVLGDLRDKAALSHAAENVDIIYHIAALYRQAGLSADVYRAVN